MANIQCPRHDRGNNVIVVSLGSNAADAIRRVAEAAAILGGQMSIEAMTGIFVTPDIHEAALRPPRVSAPRYANAVVRLSAPTPPLAIADVSALNNHLKALERSLGRMAEHKPIGLVNIDLDIVVARGRILRPADFLRPYFHPRALAL